MHFSKAEEQPEQPEIIIEAEKKEASFSQSEQREFRAETRKLLDIVAKSIYTDKEVFLRELLSNCSDALEKQRFEVLRGAAVMGEGDDLGIQISTNSKERTITIFDSGIGMDRNEVIENLGTIAKSGSQAFVKSLEDDEPVSESIIGQFGVGFYSSFVVSDYVQVISKKDGNSGVRWVSDGCGTFEVSDADNLDFERGTRIILKLLPESREFSQDSLVDKTIKKFSQFISYPIKLNGEVINQLGALWYREKREVTVDEYERFFENLANTKIPYKYHLHYSSDVPLAIKALIYFPSTHNERKGVPMQEDLNLHLYSRKVLIKEKCQELIPSYLRFIKGVVDCEDLPLNISRENYQDSNLITKLRNVLTRRIIKAIDDESKRDKDKYLKWYEDFGQFFKEGIMQDEDNRESLFKLLRVHSVNNGKNTRVSLDEYVAKMKEGQEKIYFITDQSYDKALMSPYMEPLQN